MKNISKEQLRTIGKESFISKAIAFMRQRKSEFKLITDAEARQFIVDCQSKAQTKFRLTTEKSLMTYILVCWELGADFYIHRPALNKILTNFIQTEADRAFDLYCEVYKLLKAEQ